MPGPEKPYDLVIVGGGPAGLSAAQYAESEKLDVMVLDNRSTVGGQAGTTSLIRNYPGFPKGISGPELMDRMIDQARIFGAEFMGPTQATRIEQTDSGILAVYTADGDIYPGRNVLLSTGVELKQLKAKNMAVYRGRGVTYGPPTQSEDYQGKTVYVIGGGNSAGQAALKLASYHACNVHILIRGDSIEDKMSGYLVDEIATKTNIEVSANTELNGVDGDGRLQKVIITNNKSNNVSELPADEVFVFIGAMPYTDWVPSTVVRDSDKFVVAGSALPEDPRHEFMEQTKGRPPLANETSMPGLFVAGDARSGADHRVGLAVGDGGAVVPQLHRLRSYKS